MIYFIGEETPCGDSSKYVKIGYTSRTVQDRIDDMNTGNPNDLFSYFTEPGDRGRESQLHRQFKHYRVDEDNEWFVISGPLKRYMDYRMGLMNKARYTMSPANIAKVVLALVTLGGCVILYIYFL